MFLTILDTHVASLISAAFLFQFGTGPIRGFATTLTFGLLANVFTAVFVSRTLFELVLSRRQGRDASASDIMRILHERQLDLLRWRWHALALSWLLILAGVGLIATRGLPLGIDFSGGTLVVVRFEQPVSEDAIRDAIAGPRAKGRPAATATRRHEKLIRLPLVAQASGRAARAGRAAPRRRRCRRPTSASSRCSARRSSAR